MSICLRAAVGSAVLALAALTIASRAGAAQKPPAIRQIVHVERISIDSLANVATALPMPGGRALVNDITARRLLLFDSTLAHGTVVADTTSATANAYGRSPGTLIRYRGDSALFIDRPSLSMFVLGPMGAVVRVMAIPRPDDTMGLIGGLFGTPGVDPRGRLVYYSGTPTGSVQIIRRGSHVSMDPNRQSATPDDIDQRFDSAFVARVDPATRTVDTVASFKIPKFKRSMKTDGEGLILAIETTPDPLPLIDDWALMPDGTIAVVRGRDFHVDWFGVDGQRSSSAKMPFDWQPVDDARKQTLIDSAVTAVQARLDDLMNLASGGGGGARGGGGRAGGRGGSALGPPGSETGPVPSFARAPGLNDLPDYVPPFAGGASRADADGNLWIRTTTIVAGRPVYDIVNRRGELVDRVQLPPSRTIAGFGPGVVYLAVKEADGAVHLERALIR